jgi:hypothetical protein
MDRWIISYLSDGDNVVTPRVIYKFLFESIKRELIEVSSNLNYKTLLPSFGENYKDILYEVSIHKITEYDEEYKDYNKYYNRIKRIGYRIFYEKEFKATFKKDAKVDTVQSELKKLLNSGFIMIKDEKQKKYQVANVYVPALKIKMNRQGRRK